MKRIFKKQIDNLLKKDKRTLEFIEVIYESGKKVQFLNPDHINWSKTIINATIVFKEAYLEYVGFYEGDGNYNNEGPILVPRNKIKIRPRKINSSKKNKFSRKRNSPENGEKFVK